MNTQTELSPSGHEQLTSPSIIAFQELYSRVGIVGSPNAEPNEVAAAAEEQRGRLWDITYQAIQERPEAASTLTHFANLIDYAWYQDPAAAPPDVVVMTPRGLDLDQSMLSDADLVRARYFMGSRGLNELEERRGHNFKANEKVMLDAIKAVIEETPIYQTLEAFAVDMPQPTERKLTHAEMAGREAEARNKTIGMHPQNAREYMSVAQYRIEDETRPHGSRVETDKLTNVRNFIRSIARDSKPEFVADIFDKNHRAVYVDGRTYDMQETLPSLFNESRISQDVLCKAVDELFGYEDIKLNYDQWLAKLLRQEAELVLNTAVTRIGSYLTTQLTLIKSPDLSSMERTRTADLGYRSSGLEDLDEVMYGPRPTYGETASHEVGEILEDTVSNNDTPESTTESFIHDDGDANEEGVEDSPREKLLSFSSVEKFNELKNKIIGRVVKRDKRDKHSRMLIPTPTPQELSGYIPSSADWVISMEERAEHAYYTPGYRLIGHDKRSNQYGFRREVHSPYDDILTKLTARQRERVAESAIAAGMYGLAAAIEAREELTVTDFIKLFRSKSYYHLPEGSDPLANTVFSTPQRAEDLKRFVYNDMLRGHCQIGAAALRVFLTEANIGRVGEMQSGIYVKNRRGAKLTAAPHVQLPFIDTATGKFYMIEATPPGESGRLAKVLKAAADIGGIATANIMELASKSKDTIARMASWLAMGEQVASVETQQTRVEAGLMKNRNELLGQLSKAMSQSGYPMPTDRVLESMRYRSSRDLTRIVMEIVEGSVPMHNAPAASLATSYGRAKGMLEYIHDLRTAPQKVRDPFGYASRQSLVTMLEKSLQRVVDLTAPRER